MPALITHRLFGERVAKTLPEGIITSQEELVAFLVGNQGPDPFFFRWRAPLPACHDCLTLAQQFHNEHPTRAFAAIHAGIARLPHDDAGVGRAFSLGMLAHYLLDRTTHPFIYAQEYRVIDANPELDGAEGPVHAIIEGDIDVAFLWRERHEDVRQCPPASDLAYTPRVASVGGALTSQAALSAFSREVGQAWYGACLADMRTFYRKCEPMGAPMSRFLGAVERSFRTHSQVQAMSHRVVTDGTCAWTNDAHETWTNPFYGTTSTESFEDRLDAAAAEWPEVAEAFVRGNSFEQVTRHLDYCGRDLGPAEESVAGKISLVEAKRTL